MTLRHLDQKSAVSRRSDAGKDTCFELPQDDLSWRNCELSRKDNIAEIDAEVCPNELSPSDAKVWKDAERTEPRLVHARADILQFGPHSIVELSTSGFPLQMIDGVESDKFLKKDAAPGDIETGCGHAKAGEAIAPSHPVLGLLRGRRAKRRRDEGLENAAMSGLSLAYVENVSVCFRSATMPRLDLLDVALASHTINEMQRAQGLRRVRVIGKPTQLVADCPRLPLQMRGPR